MQIIDVKSLLSKNKDQVENFLSLIIIQGLNTIIPLFLFPYLVRTLGQVQYGQAAFVISLINFLQIIIDFGFNYTGTKMVALAKTSEERSKIFYSIFFIKLLLFFVCVIILILTGILIAKVKAMFMFFVISSGLLLGNVLFPVWFFQGMEKMKVMSAFNFFIRIASLVLIVIYVKSPYHTERYVLINSLSNLIPGFFCFSYCIYLFKIEFKFPDLNQIKDIFNNGKDLFISNLIIGGYSSIRIFVIGLFSNGQLLGIYSILERIYLIIQTFPLGSFLQATYPKLVKIIETDRNKVINFMKKAANYSLLYFSVAVIIFLIVQPWLLNDVLKVKLPLNYVTLSVLFGITVVLVNYNTFRIEYLLISGNDKLFRVIHFYAGIIGTVTMLAFTYKWDVIGCAASVVLTQSTIILYTLYVYKKHLGFII